MDQVDDYKNAAKPYLKDEKKYEDKAKVEAGRVKTLEKEQ